MDKRKTDRQVGSFVDPKTKQEIRVIAKRGETVAHANQRVRAKHATR